MQVYILGAIPLLFCSPATQWLCNDIITKNCCGQDFNHLRKQWPALFSIWNDSSHETCFVNQTNHMKSFGCSVLCLFHSTCTIWMLISGWWYIKNIWVRIADDEGIGWIRLCHMKGPGTEYANIWGWPYETEDHEFRKRIGSIVHEKTYLYKHYSIHTLQNRISSALRNSWMHKRFIRVISPCSLDVATLR